MTEESAIEDVSRFLIDQRLLLTALELDFELIERGQENRVLRSFFTNPMNFENVSSHGELINTKIKSSPSVSTIDSIDFAKYSDDGMQQSDERIKVLEFELRKKTEEVRKLREELTEMSVSNTHTSFVLDWLPTTMEDSGQTGLLLAHENRTLNFLINEYLLQHRFKLTAVSFSEEVSGQDLDSWDDVGLNIPKLPSLEYLLKTKLMTLEEYSYKSTEKVKENYDNHEVQTDPMDNDILEQYICSNDELRGIIKILEHDLCTLKDVYAFAMEESKNQAQLINQLKKELNETKSKLICAQRDLVQESFKKKLLPQAPTSSGGETDVKSETVSEISNVMEEGGVADVVKCHNHIDEQEDDFGDNKCDQPESGYSEGLPQRNVTKQFVKMLQLIEDSENDSHFPSIPLVGSLDEFVCLIAESLPHLFDIVTSKNDQDLMMLLIQSTCLHPDTKQREKLLKFLINLYPEPGLQERTTVLKQIETLAGYLGAFRVEAELITQIWEMLYEKPKLNSAKRILLANICGVVCPLAPTNLRSSLILSIHQQMLEEETDPKVVPFILASIASTVPYLEDVDKIYILVQLTVKYLFRYGHSPESVKQDLLPVSSDLSVEEVVKYKLLPAVAQWSLDAGVIHSSLVHDIMVSMDNLRMNQSTDYLNINRYLSVIYALIPFLEIWVKSSVPNISFHLVQDHETEINLPTYSSEGPDIYRCTVIISPQAYCHMHTSFIRYTSINIPQSVFESPETYSLKMDNSVSCWSPWPQLRWLQTDLVDRLVSLLKDVTPKYHNVDLSDHKVISDLAKSQFTYVHLKSKDTCVKACEVLFELCRRLSYPVVYDMIVPFIAGHLYESSEKGVDCGLKTDVVVTGLVAGQAVILASLTLLNPSTISRDNLRRFLTNTFFLISAEKLSFDGVKHAITVLCSCLGTSVVTGVILPAMQPCITCPDCSVQMLMCMVLLEVVSNIPTKCAPDDNLLGEITDVLRQLTSSSHESVRVLTIGPLVSILQLPDISGSLRSKVFSSLTDLMKESVNFSVDSMDAINVGSSHPCSEIIITALIQMINIVGSSSPDSFRDDAILPWLLGITEINNSTSDTTRRAAIAMILYSTFSTLSYYLESSSVLESCLLPSLDRLKLDMLEIYPENVKEVESMSQEIRRRLDGKHKHGTNESLSGVKSKMSGLHFMSRSSAMTAATSSLFGKIREMKDSSSVTKADDQISTSSSSSNTKSNISNFFSKRK